MPPNSLKTGERSADNRGNGKKALAFPAHASKAATDQTINCPRGAGVSGIQGELVLHLIAGFVYGRAHRANTRGGSEYHRCESKKNAEHEGNNKPTETVDALRRAMASSARLLETQSLRQWSSGSSFGAKKKASSSSETVSRTLRAYTGMDYFVQVDGVSNRRLRVVVKEGRWRQERNHQRLQDVSWIPGAVSCRPGQICHQCRLPKPHV